MLRFTIVAAAALGLIGCPDRSEQGSKSGPSQGGVQGSQKADELSALSDEFDDPKTLSKWRKIEETEGWGANQLEKLAIEDGNLVLAPYTSTWYMDYRGVLVYKDTPGDFVVTAKLRVTGRDGRSAPRSMFSLGGLMVRAPRADSARSWREGGENYVFLSIGAADRPGTFQFEVKTTERSNSNLEKIPANGGETLLQIAKVGPNLVLLRDQGGSWVVHKRYFRPDFPANLQVGLTTYTDYPTASRLSAREHNATVITRGNPDLLARVDYMRYRKPVVPARTNLNNMSDGEIIQLLNPR